MARGRAALFLLSLSAILFEISLTRLASVLVHTTLTFVVIAVCLAALGLGAGFAGRRPGDETLPLRAALVASLGGALAVATVVATPLGFALGLFAVPFLGLGAFAARFYARLPSPRFTYAADALGGAAGAALAPLAIRTLGDVNAALAATAIAAGAGWLAAPAAGQRARLALLVAPMAFAGNLAFPTLDVDPWATWGFRPHMVVQAKDKGGRVLETRYDAFGRTDLVATDEAWVRYLFTDRMYTARIARWDGRGQRFADAPLEELSHLKGLAFRALQPSRVLVLGAGGGFDVALALQSGARQIQAVEINGAMLAMTRALGDFSGRIFDRPEVQAYEAEARRFLRGTLGRYDLVSLSLLQTDPAIDRANTGFQNWVFTTEAVGQYLDRLDPGGAIAVVQNSPALAEKTIATCLAALAARGVATPEAFRQLAILSLDPPGNNPFAYLVLVARDPLGTAMIEALAGAAESRIRVEHLPGVATSERLRPLSSGAEPLEAWTARAPARFDPATDDRPFFYDVNRALPWLFVILALGGLTLLLALWARDRFAGAGPRLPTPAWLSAAALGAGFLLLQAGLISRGQFLIGTPTLAVALVVGGMLAAASSGAILGGLVFQRPRRRLVVGSTCVAAAALAEALAWPALAANPPASTAGLVAVTLGLVGAIGLPVGFCLPAVFEIYGAPAASSIYAANALATVTASAMATLLAQRHGLLAVFVAGSLAYATTAALALRRPGPVALAVAPGLRSHVPADPCEGRHLVRILAFVAAHAQPFDRHIAEGHLTGSALVVSASGAQVLLLHHRKLGFWLQPGGHGASGETTGEAVAMREALEETGIAGLALHPTAPRPLDVDVHAIPARGDEPAHEHLDLRYLVIAPGDAAARHNPDESHALGWFTWAELETMDLDVGLRRALGKVKGLLALTP